ncbi:MAG: hypothetical protein IKU29_02280, partial [Parabacteroides sp.]|nr:hypothetical protein [Parabacteroides sp.]
MSELLSYARLLKDRDNFRKSGTKGGSDFNLYETPGNLYFRILFYFHNGDVDGGDRYDSGLLAPTWDENMDNNYYEYSSAWS